jgi:hypothetical protein
MCRDYFNQKRSLIMPRIHKLSCLIVLLLASVSFAAETAGENSESFVTYTDDKGPREEIVIEGPITIKDSAFIRVPTIVSGRMGAIPGNMQISSREITENKVLISCTDINNLVYSIKIQGAKKNSDTYYLGVTITLRKTPSFIKNEEIRKKYFDLACKDLQSIIQAEQDKIPNKQQTELTQNKDKLSQIEDRIQKLNFSKTLQKVNIEILGYLYKEKVKLDLDRLEQRAKLEAIANFYDRVAAARKEIDKTEEEIGEMTKELRQIASPEQVKETQIRIDKTKKEWRSLKESLANNPENTTPKEQYVDVKITQVATQKRYQEVEKLISQYEQAAKTPADESKINAQLKELENERDRVESRISYNEDALKSLKDHPVVSVFDKKYFDDMQSKKVKNEVNAIESEEKAQ